MTRTSTAVLIAMIVSVGSPVTCADMVDLLGDKDGFGVGCPIASGLHYLDYGSVWADNRDPGDADFTDIWDYGDRNWAHTYDLGGMTPSSAKLEIFVAGIADSADWSADVLVNGALVGTIPGIGDPDAHDLTRLLSFDVPVSLIDGSSPVLLDVSAYGDGWILDYSELTIEPIPAPAAVLLGVIGLGMVGRVKRRFY